jgi:hypothetical protein
MAKLEGAIMTDEKKEYLEKEIFNQVGDAIGKAIAERLTSYNTPLAPMIASVIESRNSEIRAMLNKAMDGVLIGDFRTELQAACTHKLARVLISKMEGEIEKTANELRSNPEFRARLTLAISEVVKGIAVKS